MVHLQRSPARAPAAGEQAASQAPWEVCEPVAPGAPGTDGAGAGGPLGKAPRRGLHCPQEVGSPRARGQFSFPPGATEKVLGT